MPRPPRLSSLVLALAACGAPAPSAPARAPAPPPPPHWVATWSAAPQPAPSESATDVYESETVRLVVRTSLGGPRVRIRVANVYGSEPLFVGAAHVARRQSGADVDPATDRALSFGGLASTTIAAGASAWSDPVALETPALAELCVSLFLPHATRATTLHVLAQQTSYVARKGRDATGDAKLPVARTIDTWPFVDDVDVEAPEGAASLVALGDSLTDGDGSTPDANRRWLDALAGRLAASDAAGFGLSNEGIIGNRLLYASPRGAQNPLGPALGPSALSRFERDVLGQSSARVLVVAIGINDLGFAGSFGDPGEAPTRDEMIAGYRAIVDRAKRAGLHVFVATLPPFEDAKVVPGYFTPDKDRLRTSLNDWMRAGSAGAAGVLDFDAVLRDPARPARLRPELDSGDHLHPNDAGYAAMAAVAARAVAAVRP